MELGIQVRVFIDASHTRSRSLNGLNRSSGFFFRDAHVSEPSLSLSNWRSCGFPDVRFGRRSVELRTRTHFVCSRGH